MNQRYFPHDIDAVTDPKLQNILREKGLEGIGAYWCIIERLYRQDGVLQESDLASIAWSLHLPNEDLLTSIVRDYGLFTVNGRTLTITSKRVTETITFQKEATEKRVNAGRKGGKAKAMLQQSQSNATTDAKQMPSENDGNAQAINKEINKEIKKSNTRNEMKGGRFDPSSPNYAYRDIDEKMRKLREGN